jgi:hypothetical protein
MFMDVRDEITGKIIRKSIGGSGSALYYVANSTPEIPEFPANTNIFSYDDLEDERARPIYGDLLINVSLGTFLKVEESNYENDQIVCTVLAVSGGNNGSDSDPSSGQV